MGDSIVPPPQEHLTTGWEPDLQADDTLVRQAVLVHASWPCTVAASTGRPWRKTPGWSGAWIGDRGALTNLVFLTQPLRDLATVLDEITDLIPERVPFALFSPWPTADLRQHGLALIGHPPLMTRIAAPPRTSPPADVEVREVTNSEQLAVAERILVAGYPMPDLEPLTAGDLLGPEILRGSTRVWLGYVDGEPVSVAAAFMSSGVTLVEYVAALPKGRGRGAGSAVTWAATLAEPDRPAVLIASDEGRPVYERMGYLPIERWTVWLRPGT